MKVLHNGDLSDFQIDCWCMFN